jgi:hypothetical protein
MTLLKKLKYLGSVRVSLDWRDIPLIKTSIRKGHYSVVSSGWHDRFKSEHPDRYPLDLVKDYGTIHNHRSPWSSYDGCRDLEIEFRDGGIFFHITIWDGDNMDGRRMKRRWSATLTGIKAGDIEPWKDAICRRFDRELDYLFDHEEQARKDKRKKEIAQEILGK